MGDLIGYRVGGHDKQDRPEARVESSPCDPCRFKQVFSACEILLEVLDGSFT